MLKRLCCVLVALIVITPVVAAASTPPVGTMKVVGDNTENDDVEVSGHDEVDLRDPGFSGVVHVKRIDWEAEFKRRADEIKLDGGVPCDSNADGSPTQQAILNTWCTPLINGRPIADPDEEQARALDFIRDYFRRIDIPQPQPEISAKNGGICGVEHTIDLHMQPEMVFQEGETDFGPLDFHVYGVITVDWGDGQKNLYKTGGGPYPNNAISHVWTNKGFYDINATANWVANVTLGPDAAGNTYTGSLSGIVTQGAIQNFRVWDLQAVLIN